MGNSENINCVKLYKPVPVKFGIQLLYDLIILYVTASLISFIYLDNRLLPSFMLWSGHFLHSNTIHGLKDQYTKEQFSASKVTFKPDGSMITDNDVDNIIYFRNGDAYFKRTITGAVNVKWFGAKGNGITSDFKAIKKALDRVKELEGTDLFFPKGIYVIDNAGGLDLHSNLNIKGEGIKSVLLQKDKVNWLMSANKGAGGSRFVKDNLRNINISGIHFKADAGTFQEHTHLLNLNAVSDVTVDKCFFTGFRGDGIYIGSSNTAGVERHNENVMITNSVFNGVNKQNRNAISIIDGKKILIQNNTFQNTTASNMPGAIDIEPDIHPFSIIEDIAIYDNTFKNIGGNVAAIAVVCNNAAKSLNQNINVCNNYFENCGTIFSTRFKEPTAKSPSNKVSFYNNTVKKSDRPFIITQTKGLSIYNNKFEGILYPTIIGYNDGLKTYDIQIYNNYFDRCAIKDGSQLFAFFHVNGLQFEKNTMKDCTNGNTGSNFLLYFKPGILKENIVVRGNKAYRTDGKTQYFTVDNGASTVAAKNIYEDNTLDTNTILGSLRFRRDK